MLREFIQVYFIQPLLAEKGYNPINTIAYATITVISAYLIFKLLERLKIKIDKRFATAILPYVLLGAVLRVFKDAGITNNYLFVTPFLFFWGTPATIFLLLVSLILEKKLNIPYFKFMFLIGLIAFSFFLIQIPFINFFGAALVYLFFLPWLIFFGILKFWPVENRIVSLIHMLDANTTYVSISFFGYSEQHVLPNLFMKSLGSWSFIPLKLFAIVCILVLIDKFLKDKEFNNFLKICMGVIGGFTSSRDFIRLLALV